MNFYEVYITNSDSAAIGKRRGIPTPNIIVMKMIFWMFEYC
jgi:hypothetical protein